MVGGVVIVAAVSMQVVVVLPYSVTWTEHGSTESCTPREMSDGSAYTHSCMCCRIVSLLVSSAPTTAACNITLSVE